MKIGFIGVGNMGSALAKAVSLVSVKNEIYVNDSCTEKAEAFCRANGAEMKSNEDMCRECDVVFLGVKPQVLISLLEQIAPALNKALVVSMAAGVGLESIEEKLGVNCPVIRIMPNIPVSVGKGVVLYCANKSVTQSQISAFEEIMSGVGMLDNLDEKLFDAASALSGCGPAFVAMFIESLADGAVSCGVPRDKALAYAINTVVGTAEYLNDTKMHPSALKDAVCSPAGSTIEGVKKLEEGRMRATVENAVCASYRRTKELGK